ncbi:uncharacterized protein MELLADRAFT_115875 [Melampsora larici-populina 98AG31]|uniref:FHF complex subunit HOOK-interacting protein C-terminal domain-containing protein n=1 Tax=Melampsora larici-populina (strain 98AG31 / pathotype 3-4-7) TaxID=747676 RepID=F4RFA3_MELLP|nr:uncharacterized protein MELLADRAFT_115875 [Melampsora larici-populina 98AG31]EGG08970.1 hypothetical protein MELLADRAFT_115875 [Melampsora larici-populina 98AG31]
MSFLKNVFGSSSSRSISNSVGSTSRQANSALTQNVPSTLSALASFQNSWLAIKNALSSPAHRHVLLESTSIKDRLDTMWECLAIENHIPVSVANPNGSGSLSSTHAGECVEYFLKNDVPGTLVALSLPDQPVGVKGLVIGFFLSLVVFMDEHFVVHSKVHKPLVRLLRSCVEPELDAEEGDDAGWRTKESAYEEAVVEVMCLSSSNISSTVDGHTSTSRVSTSPSLESPSPALKGDSDMLIFSYLLRFLHREGRTGDLARAGLLFLMELAMGRRIPPTPASPHGPLHKTLHRLEEADSKALESGSMAFGEWILDSDFADVLGAGLGAAYGLLPSRLVITPRNPLDHDGSGGMVLGGMGTHLSDDATDPQTAEEREREQRRTRLLVGLGVSGSEEFRTQMDLFMKLIEFTQDVLRNTTSSPLHHYISAPDPPTLTSLTTPKKPTLTGLSAHTHSPYIFAPSEEVDLGPTPSEIVAAAISSSVLNSIQKLFLNAIMYPSILECSEQDGSAVAVMSYLEAMLSLLETDGELADGVLRFLMTEDDEGLDPMPLTGNAPHHQSARDVMNRRRKSGAIQIIEAEFNKARGHGKGPDGLMSISGTGITYFNSLGRFTLKDLLINNVRSLDGPTATSALKLFHVIVNRHDRYALALLDIRPDPCATAFPFPNDVDELLHLNQTAGSKQLQLFGSTGAYPTEDEDDEDDEEFTYPVINPPQTHEEEMFVYPTTAKNEDGPEEFTYPAHDRDSSVPRLDPAPHRLQSQVMSTPATPHFLKPALELADRIQRSPCPTYQTHRDALDYLTSLIQLIEPSGTVMKQDMSQNPMSTAFGHYLLDAETELTNTATFRRGLLSDCVSASIMGASSQSDSLPCISPQTSMYTQGARLDSEMNLIDYPVIRHGLSAEAPLISSLLESLTRFFTQSPELNLILTGCVASLASCPTRSLDGWLLPVLNGIEGKMLDGESMWVTESSKLELGQDDGDDRSIDFAVEELATSIAEESRRKSAWVSSGEFGDSVLEIYRQLAEQVASYRKSVPGFDKYLHERRQGLVFVENLEDALEGDTSPFGATEEAQAMSPPPPPPIVENAPATKIATPVTEPKSKPKEISFFASLFRPANGAPKKSSPSNRASSRQPQTPTAQTPDRATGFQPFSEHYRQTGSIKLNITPVQTPASTKKHQSRKNEWDFSDDETTSGPETPTKKTRNGTLVVEDQSHKEDRKTKTSTSLSMVLDNVVVLEEALKEIGAIVSARKSLGIDPVRFL